MDLDVNKEIRRAVDTGSVVFGSKQCQKNVLKGNGKLIIVSRNTPKLLIERVKQLGVVSGIPCYDFKGTGLTLGSVCGKPFIVGCLLVQDVGKSRVMDLLQEKKVFAKKIARKKAVDKSKKSKTKTPGKAKKTVKAGKKK